MGRLPGIEFGQQASGIREQAPRVNPNATSTGGAIAELGTNLRNMSDYVIKTYQEGSAKKTLASAQAQLQGLAQRLKYGEEDPETGERRMIPPDQHDEIYRKEVDRIQKAAERGLHGQGYVAFQDEYRSFAERQGLSVTAHAIEQMHSESKVITDENLHTYSNTFVQADNLEKPIIQKNAYGLVDRMVQNGVLTPEEGAVRKRKFDDDAQTGSFLKMLKQKDGPKAAILAIDSGEFKSLPADRQQQLRNMAINEEERQVTLSLRKIERAELMERRKEAEVNKKTAKEGFTLMNKTNPDGTPQLTPDWVEQNRNNLSVDHYRLFLDVSSGRHEVQVPNFDTLADLTTRAASGEDVTDLAVTAAKNQQIRTQDLTSIQNLVRQEGVGPSVKNWRKRMFDHVKTAFMPGPGSTDDPVAKLRAANAINELQQWFSENPKATEADAQLERDSIVKSHMIINYEAMRSTIPVPRTIEAGVNLRTERDPGKIREILKRAYKETERRGKANEMSPEEVRREKARISRFEATLPPVTLEPKQGAK